MTTATLPNRSTTRSRAIIIGLVVVAIATITTLLIGLVVDGDSTSVPGAPPAPAAPHPGTPDSLERRVASSSQLSYRSPTAVDRRQLGAASERGSGTYGSAEAAEHRTLR